MALALALVGLGPVGTAGAASSTTVRIWGAGAGVSASLPVLDAPITAVAGGYGHSLALQSDGTVVAWGDNTNGQSEVPTDLTDVVAIGAGSHHSLAVRSDGTVAAWGDNTYRQSEVPTDLTDVVAVAGGGTHSVALRSDGTVVAWGGVGTWATVPQGLTDVTAIAAGGTHTVALRSDGTVVAFGGDTVGQTVVPTGLTGVTAIAAGDRHSLAVTADGTVVAWGSPGMPAVQVPVNLTDVVAVATGNHHSLALTSDGTVVAWGSPDWVQSTVPDDLPKASAIAAGALHNLAIVEQGVGDEPGDTTPPSVTPLVSGTQGTHDWYTSDVEVGWLVEDSESTAAAFAGDCHQEIVDRDTTGTTIDCTASSAGGATTASVTIKRDATPPTIAPALSSDLVLLNSEATVTPGATDDTSGIDESATGCEPITSSALGAHTVTCHAADLAGNIAEPVGVGYQVVAPFESWQMPLPRSPVRAGSTLRVRFTLADADGTMTAADGEQLASNGQIRVVLTQAVKGAPELAAASCTWEKANAEFSCSLRTPRVVDATAPYYVVVQETDPSRSRWFAAPNGDTATGLRTNALPVRFR